MAVSFTPTVVSNPAGAQGSYPLELTVGHEGMIADLQAYVSRSYYNQSGVAIPFGSLVATDNDPGTNDPFAVLLAPSGSAVVGLAADSLTFEGVPGANASYTPNPTNIIGDGSLRAGYPNGQALNVVSKGVVWVYSTAAIALGDAVRFFGVDHSATVTNAYVGRFTKTAVANKTFAMTGGVRWLSETSAAGLVLLEIDLPGITFTADV
jgi:hypothetical protein